VENAGRYKTYPLLARGFNDVFMNGGDMNDGSGGCRYGQGQARTAKSEHQLGQAVWRLKKKGLIISPVADAETNQEGGARSSKKRKRDDRDIDVEEAME